MAVLADGLPVDGPYKGLVPYGEEDAAFFFGREQERRIIAANLRTSSLTLVYGQSGVGKTSVLRAGVVHALQEDTRREIAEGRHPRYVVVPFRNWQDDPAAALAESVAEALGVPKGSSSFVDLLEGSAETEVLVILDQFEECLDLLSRAPGDGRFSDELVRALDDPTLRAHFLISIREDALARLDRFKGQIPGLFANYLRIDNLSAEAGRAAIEGPLAVYSDRLAATGKGRIEIDEALVDAVLEQVRAGRITVGQGGRGGTENDDSSMRIETPYLQLVMTKIWEEERRLGSDVLRRETLDRLGGAEEIVKAHLDEQMSELSRPEQDIAAQVFDRLVTPSGMKLAQSIDDLALYSGVEREALEPVLEKLSGRGRILQPLPAPPSQPGATRYQIFHDRLAGAVLDWRRRYLEQEERERQVAAERRRTRRLRRIVGALIGVVVLVAGVAAAMVWLWVSAEDAKRQADADAARALAASSRTQIATDPRLAVQTALRGFRKKRTVETIDALRASLLASHQLFVRKLKAEPFGLSPDGRSVLLVLDARPPQVVGLGGTQQTLGRVPADAAISLDGRSAVTLRSGRARLWTVGRPSSQPLRARGIFETAAFSPDGRFVVAFDVEGGSVFDAMTGRTVGPRFESGLVTDAALSRGARILAVGDGGGVALLRPASGKRLKRLDAGHLVSTVAISPDGRLVAGATADGAKVWGPDGGDPVTCGTGAASESLAFSRDGRLVASGQDDGTAVICDPVLGRELAELRGHKRAVTSISFTADSRRLFTAGEDKTVRVWRIGVVRLPGAVKQASFDPTGRRIVTVNGTSFHVWGLSGQELHTVAVEGLRGASLNPGGTLAATVGKGGAKLWRVADGEQLRSTVLPRRHVSSIAFDRSGKRVVVAVGNTARVVDIGGSASAPPFRAPAPPWLESVSFSHDGTLIVAGSHEGAVVWRLDRRSPPKLLPESDVLSAEASRNGEFVVTSGPEGASVWKWESPKRLTRLPDQLKVRDAGFSPDGTLVVAGSGDGFAQVADWRLRDRVLAFGDTQGPPVTSAAFSPDGTKILLTLGPAGAIVLDCPGCGSPNQLEERASATKAP